MNATGVGQPDRRFSSIGSAARADGTSRLADCRRGGIHDFACVAVKRTFSFRLPMTRNSQESAVEWRPRWASAPTTSSVQSHAAVDAVPRGDVRPHLSPDGAPRPRQLALSRGLRPVIDVAACAPMVTAMNPSRQGRRTFGTGSGGRDRSDEANHAGDPVRDAVGGNPPSARVITAPVSSTTHRVFVSRTTGARATVRNSRNDGPGSLAHRDARGAAIRVCWKGSPGHFLMPQFVRRTTAVRAGWW